MNPTMWASLCFLLCLGQSFTEITQYTPLHFTTTTSTSSPLLLSLSLSLFSLLSLSLYLKTPFLFTPLSLSFSINMKKMKVVTFANRIDSSSCEVSRARLRFQSLFQDFEDLSKENEANRSRLEMMKQKKKTLMAQVRFLRRRYSYLKQTQSQNSAVVRNYVQTRKLAATGGKNLRGEKNSIANGAAALRPPVPPFDLNQKGKIHSEREAIFRSPAPSSEVMIKKQKGYGGKGAALRSSSMIPDLNQKEINEATVPKITPIFDLNQISGEEEELQENCKGLRVEDPKLSSARGAGANDDQHNDIKLSVCRNIGNGSSQAGKRKISWQDRVALRV